MRQFVLGSKRVVIGHQIVAFRLGQRPAVGASGEAEQSIEVLRLGVYALLFQSPKRGVDAVKVIANGLRSDGIVLRVGLRPWPDRHRASP